MGDIPATACHYDPTAMPHPKKTRVVFARKADGLSFSINATGGWEQISTTPGDLLAPDHEVPGRILWARRNEIWARTNGGADWTKLTALRWRQAFFPMVRK